MKAERSAEARPELPTDSDAVGGTQDAEDELQAERARAELYERNWQRAAADLANYKRRVEEERAAEREKLLAAQVAAILPLYDDLGRAVEAVETPLAGLAWVQGVEAISRKFGQLLEGLGVTEIPAAEEQFDPHRHEAVGRQPGEEGRVLQVVQKGYLLGDTVVRPAMVIVGDGEVSADNEETTPG